MDCEFYYYTCNVRFYCCWYWLLIYLFIFVTYWRSYMFITLSILLVIWLVNINDNSLIFNWQPLQNHATYLLTEMKKKSFLNRLYLFPWAKHPIFLNIKSPKQKQNKFHNLFFYFSSSNIAKQIFLRICLINSNVNIVVVVHMPLSNLNMSKSKYKILYS